jgi:hypothetical protein
MWERFVRILTRVFGIERRAATPFGISEEQFAALSAAVRPAVLQWSQDIRVHGSRVAGSARPDSDLDIAILVTPDRFDQILVERFGQPNPGSAKERTMLHARETGKIQAGEAGLREVRRAAESILGMEIDLSVIRIGGPFDQGPYIPLRPT